MRVVHVVGARPNFMKLAPLITALSARNNVEQLVVHTGQHYDENMSAVFFAELGLPEPNFNLGIGSGTHAEQTGHAMLALEPVFASADPNWIVVIGDVNSSLAAAIVGAKLGIRIAHVEAGLRSWERKHPEEINRVLVDHLSSLNFCPGPTAARNLAAEGVVSGVHIVGDVMYDLILGAMKRTTGQASAAERLNLVRRQYVVATVHRPSNTDRPDQLAAILACLAAADLPVVFPLHPRTRAALDRSSLRIPANVHVVEPQTYLGMVALLRDARAVITDSGGVQREAFWLQVPCLTLREETEWVETVEHGWNHLVGADPDRVRGALAAPRPSTAPPPVYGDGTAADRIAAILTGTIEPPATMFGM